MDLNRNYACKKNCCGPCQEPHHSVNTLPEVNKVKCNAHNCEIVRFDPNGLGRAEFSTMNHKIVKTLDKLTRIPTHVPHLKDKMRYYGPRGDNNNRLQRNTVQGGAPMMSGGDARVAN